jgi:transcriptional regulator with GAF, ATPase, and Fis domain
VPEGAPARHPNSFFGILGSSQPMQRIFRQVRQVAPTDASVLILGESGTGKELVARAVHGLSPRKDQPLVTLNCAALPASLIESELFGHQKGAFTGATDRRIGKFELAHKGTLFLDEVGELPLELQAKLLRVLQEKEIERLGSNTPIATDVRVVAATNRDLAQEVREGRFRADLYYRLHVFPITVPPLRDRKEDLPLLAEHLVRKCVQQLGRPYRGIAPQALAQLLDYAWPGNVRELENLITQAVILHDAPTPLTWGELLTNRLAATPSPGLPPVDSGHHAAASRPVEALEHALGALQQTGEKAGSSATTVPVRHEKPYKLKEVERLYMMWVLAQTGGRIRGEGGASQVLGVKPTTLESRIAKMGLKKGHYAYS